jgi:hypothetical protein
VDLQQFAEWLEATPPALIVRESLWGFPILVAFHLLSLTISAGIVVWFDLRLLGVSMRRQPVSQVYRRLMPIAFVGFAIAFVSGAWILAGFATNALDNVYFRIKAAALLLAGVNALVYHFITERTIATWDLTPKPPLAARTAGIVSLGVWTVVILAGRMMSYTMF